MILVADSGSTNTDWIVIHENKISSDFTTNGFNPYFTNSKEIRTELEAKFPSSLQKDEISHIFFYGAGCSNPDMKKIVYEGLYQFFDKSKIDVDHDLLGAARALFDDEAGIAVILGTGASTCLYDGQNIIKNIPSLGFILGDEGGGDYLGKLFITEYLYGNLPHEIVDVFYKKYSLTNSELMHKIYKGSYPNRFLASLSEFILDNSQHMQIANLIKKTFRDLFLKHITKYENYIDHNIRITGSVGFYFKDYINEIAKEFNANIDLIEKSPVTRIALYHIKH